MPGFLLIDNKLKNPNVSISGFTGIDPSSNFKFCLTSRLSSAALWNTAVLSQQISIDLGAPESVGACAIAGHNLGLDGETTTLRLLYSFAPGGPYTEVGNSQVTEGNSTGVFGENVTAQYWRIRIENTMPWQAPNRFIAYISLGEAIELPRIQAPIIAPSSQPCDNLRNISENGDLVSVDEYFKPLELDLSLSNYEESFFLENYPKFAANLLKQPFFYLWNTDYQDQTVYCWADKSVSLPKWNKNYLMDWQQKINAVKAVI